MLLTLQCTANICKNLSTGIFESEFENSHVEADTAILTISHKLREQGYKGTVVIDAEDTDVYVQAAYVLHNTDGQLFIKRKKTFIDSRGLLQREIADTIIQLHSLTGCDHNNGFYDKGKKKILEKLMKLAVTVW